MKKTMKSCMTYLGAVVLGHGRLLLNRQTGVLCARRVHHQQISGLDLARGLGVLDLRQDGLFTRMKSTRVKNGT
jgi:hypothetical protein